MKKLIISFGLISCTFLSTAFANSIEVENPPSNLLQLSESAAAFVGNLLLRAEQSGNKNVSFEGGPNVTIYSVGNLSCYLQNGSDFASCTTEQQLSDKASQVVGSSLRQAQLRGNSKVKFEGGPNMMIYSVGNLSCYYQNSDDSVTCSLTN